MFRVYSHKINKKKIAVVAGPKIDKNCFVKKYVLIIISTLEINFQYFFSFFEW